MRLRSVLAGAFCLVISSTSLAELPHGNRLTYLDGSDPYYVSREFPRLATEQWVGEEGVEAVVVLGIDDLKDKPDKWEKFLRPIIEHLTNLYGTAPVSIMTNHIPAEEPQLQKWLKEGLSLETHTFDHPCTLLQGGDFAKAKSTYDRCIDLMASVPGNKSIAFRMPCCDSMNSPSPRFYAEIFNSVTPAGRFLSLDTSVFNVISGQDPAVSREVGLDEKGSERFRPYLPSKSYVNTIDDYPYPYPIGRMCWEFPCVVPSDCTGMYLRESNNPATVRDMKFALDGVVAKHGVYNFVFHPHGWIRSEQVNQIITHAHERYGKRVKFLTFRDALERINKNLLAGQPLRDEKGGDNGVRLLDVNGDGYQDVVIGNDKLQQTRIWSPKEHSWTTSDFPALLVDRDEKGKARETGVHFGIVGSSSATVMLFTNNKGRGAWRFQGNAWKADESLLRGLELDGAPLVTSRNGTDSGVRLADIDGDGQCELIVGNPSQRAVFRWDNGWHALPFALPEEDIFVRRDGRDAGLRLVDVDEDGDQDLLFSNEFRFSLRLFTSMSQGWSQLAVAGKRGDKGAIPMISRAGTNNGAWFHGRSMWVQNEDTDRLADKVERRSFAEMLRAVESGPKSPQAGLQSIKLRPGFTAELMAAEPLVMDPIAFAWGPDAKLWVVEMADYPSGIDGHGKHGGRVRYLEDTDGDGHYDGSQVFLSGLGFPTGVAPWRNGVLVTCAPDILYTEDTDGDGSADRREVLYTGFVEGNQQHRVNGLKWGLDGWLYCANGDSGGKIKSLKTGAVTDLGGRDLRIKPDEGLAEAQTGNAQYGRSRDDWGNWFGCNNSNPMFHFVLDEHYLRRNSHFAPPDSRVDVSIVPGPSQVFPLSNTLARFNELQSAGRFTSANSVIVYRDELFGPDFAYNSFVSEPVHNLVHREIMSAKGLTFTSHRAADEKESEFLASTDNWFRPTMLETGPDGALWLADMYRQVIEHPEWIPKDWQRRLDLRAGHDKGRLYRVYPVHSKPRAIPRLDKLPTAELVDALDTPNGWQRDMVQQLLTWRKNKPDAGEAAVALRKLVTKAERPVVRMQSLCTLDTIGALKSEDVKFALIDPHPGVRQHAIRLAERLNTSSELAPVIARLASDPDPQVRLQLAYSLGEWFDAKAGDALATVTVASGSDRFITAAVLSSVNKANIASLLGKLLETENQPTPHTKLVNELTALCPVIAPGMVGSVFKTLASRLSETPETWRLEAIGSLLAALDRHGIDRSHLQKHAGELARVRIIARRIAMDSALGEDQRRAAVRILGREPREEMYDLGIFRSLLEPAVPAGVQAAAIDAFVRIGGADVPEILLARWKGYAPARRAQVLDVLLSRSEWTSELLNRIEAKQFPAGEIDATRRQRLLTLKDEKIRQRASRILAATMNPDRQKILDQHKDVLMMRGDIAAGMQVFGRRCAVCHQLGGSGHEVGPNLATLSDSSPQFLLTSILDPNRAVEAKFLNYLAITNDGLTHTGMLATESGNSVTLLGQEGKKDTLLRSDIDELESTGKSLMPEGLEKDLSRQDLANVIAYMRSIFSPRRNFPGNQPELVKASSDGALQLYATNAQIYGKTIILEQLYKNLGYWISPEDRAVWSVEVPRAGIYEVIVNYACSSESAGNKFIVTVADQSVAADVRSTGGWDNYQKVSCGDVSLPAGLTQVSVQAKGSLTRALMDLGGIELRPVR